MLDTTPATDLERRKQVKLLLRKDIVIAPQRYEGRTYYVVKDPVSLRYYRFKEQERFLIGLMDGLHTLDDTQKAFETQFRPERLTLEDLEQFGQQLLKAGLVQNEAPQAGQQLYEQRVQRRRMELLGLFTNILYIKIPIFDPDRLLGRMVPWFRWVFTTWFFLFSCCFLFSALMLVLTHFDTFRARLPSFHEFFSLKTVAYVWIAMGVVKVIHEFGHGLSCKTFGGEVHEMGFLLLCFSPAMYCNVSDAWTIPSKWKRIIIGGAGIYVEVMIAALATFVWWNTPGYPFLNHMCLCLMLICSVNTLVFNGNPLMRFDGYYVLSDWLEIPNLRERSNRYVSRVLMDKCLGIELVPEPYMERWRRILFVSYAVLSYVYRWVVTFVILTFMSKFLAPYGLQIISTLLTFVALGSMLGWPTYRLIKNIRKRGRLPDMKPMRVTISSVIVALLLLAFFFLPLPVSRIREPGLVQVQPGELVPLHVGVNGILNKVHVSEGEEVPRGKILAEFTNLDLESRRAQVQTVLEIKSKLVQLYESEISRTRDARDLARLKNSRVKAETERLAALQSLDEVSAEMKRLVVRAPRAGIVLGLPTPDEIGKRWEKDQPTPFCSIGDPRKLRVLVPLAPHDYNDLLLPDLKKQGPNRHLAVTVRVQGRANKTWSGRISSLPQSEAREIPLALSTRGGGPLAIKPGSSQEQPIPQAQVFLVGVDIDDPDDAICPGALAQVKIHCEYRTCAWWVWRALSSTFDLGLL